MLMDDRDDDNIETFSYFRTPKCGKEILVNIEN